MKMKKVTMYLDETTYDDSHKYIKENNLKASAFYRDMFKLGFEQKTKKGKYFLSNEYMLEIMFRTLLTAEQSNAINKEVKQQITVAAENKVIDLMTK